jgi:hypothetical protein
MKLTKSSLHCLNQTADCELNPLSHSHSLNSKVPRFADPWLTMQRQPISVFASHACWSESGYLSSIPPCAGRLRNDGS